MINTAGKLNSAARLLCEERRTHKISEVSGLRRVKELGKDTSEQRQTGGYNLYTLILCMYIIMYGYV